MKKNINKVYKIELLILIFILICQINIKSTEIYNIINIIFWTTLLVILIITGGFPKDKNFQKASTIRLVIISILTYLILSYVLGLFTGFTKTVYSKNIKDILKNIIPPATLITLIELIRYLILKKTTKKIERYILTILLITYNIFPVIIHNDFNNTEKIFIFISTILIPQISREFLYTYMTYNISFIPTLILHITINLYIFIVPIIPNLGNYLSSVLGLLMPYFIYKEINKEIKYKEKNKRKKSKLIIKKISIILTVILMIIILLVSGIFKYQIVAIASNSMKPIYEKGDAVIIEKKNPNKIKEQDIIVFKKNNTYITHRVIEIIKNENNYNFITKGDNNKELDKYQVPENEVIGTVKYIIKYLGFPTIWLNEQKG